MWVACIDCPFEMPTTFPFVFVCLLWQGALGPKQWHVQPESSIANLKLLDKRLVDKPECLVIIRHSALYFVFTPILYV